MNNSSIVSQAENQVAVQMSEVSSVFQPSKTIYRFLCTQASTLHPWCINTCSQTTFKKAWLFEASGEHEYTSLLDIFLRCSKCFPPQWAPETTTVSFIYTSARIGIFPMTKSKLTKQTKASGRVSASSTSFYLRSYWVSFGKEKAKWGRKEKEGSHSQAGNLGSQKTHLGELICIVSKCALIPS